MKITKEQEKEMIRLHGTNIRTNKNGTRNQNDLRWFFMFECWKALKTSVVE